jgi:hypothetical protein
LTGVFDQLFICGNYCSLSLSPQIKFIKENFYHCIFSPLIILQTLQSHFHPDVAKKAQRIDQPLSKEEIPLGDLLETSYNDVRL